jgi:hypothetical protein
MAGTDMAGVTTTDTGATACNVVTGTTASVVIETAGAMDVAVVELLFRGVPD